MDYTWDLRSILKHYPLFLDGAMWTLGLAACGVVVGVLLGSGLAMLKIAPTGGTLFQRIVNWVRRFIASVYIEFIRGTPAMVQIFVVFYGLPQLLRAMGLNVDLSRFWTGALALGINSAAYVAEIIRSGIQSVDVGQMEAARSLGMKKSAAMGRIIMPQAIRNILPALGNEFIIVIKESSIVSIIGITELMYKAKALWSNTYRYFEVLLIVSVFYFIITFTLSKLIGGLEKRMRRS